MQALHPLIPQRRSSFHREHGFTLENASSFFIDIHGFIYKLCCETNIMRTYSSTSNELLLTGVASSKYLKLVLKIYNSKHKLTPNLLDINIAKFSTHSVLDSFHCSNSSSSGCFVCSNYCFVHMLILPGKLYSIFSSFPSSLNCTKDSII